MAQKNCNILTNIFDLAEFPLLARGGGHQSVVQVEVLRDFSFFVGECFRSQVDDLGNVGHILFKESDVVDVSEEPIDVEPLVIGCQQLLSNISALQDSS